MSGDGRNEMGAAEGDEPFGDTDARTDDDGRRPHLLLVTVDSLRADHVSCVAGDRAAVETPALDALAADGTAFGDAVSQGPFTTFSMPSLFTSRYPSGLPYVEFSESVVGVAPGEATTVTEQLSEAGYRTGGFHSNPLLSELFGFDRGFEAFDADLPFSEMELPGRLKLLSNKLRRLVRRHAYLPAEQVTDRALSWFRDLDESAPAFLWAHYMDPHGPYQEKGGFAYRNKYRAERLWQKAVRTPERIIDDEHAKLRETYRDEVVYTDEHVGRLVEGVRAATDRPVVVGVTADHGDGFGEHGYYSHPHHVHDELVRVPLVVADPTGTVGTGRVDAPAELLDVAPTLLAAAGVDLPESFEGTPLRTESGEAGEPRAISEGELDPGYRAAVLTRRWKFVVDDIGDGAGLFDRNVDPGERTDVSDGHPEVARRLGEVMTDHRSRAAADERTVAEDLSGGDTRDRLRQLGYLE